MTLAWRRSSHCAYNGNCAELATTPATDLAQGLADAVTTNARILAQRDLAAAETAIRADERRHLLARIGDIEYLAPCDGRCPHTRPDNHVRGGKHLHRVTDLLEPTRTGASAERDQIVASIIRGLVEGS